MAIKTNDIKKGAKIRLRNGWKATVADNKKGNIRLATVEGICTETGSTYVWDWQFVINDDNSLTNIELTPKQVQARAAVRRAGF